MLNSPIKNFSDSMKHYSTYQSQFIEMFGAPVKNDKNLGQKNLSALGKLERGVSKFRPRNAPELLDGPYPLVQTGDVANCDIYITNYNSTYSEIGLRQSKLWPSGTLCITIAANIAKTGILTFDACFPDSIVGFIPDKDVDILYIHFWFKMIQQHIENLAPSTAQKNINLSVLSNLKVICPPISDQKKFSKILEQADKSKFTSLKSQFIGMFGTLDEPKVDVKRLRDVVNSSGQYGSNSPATDYELGMPRYIRITDINDDGSLNDDIRGATDMDRKYKLMPGDIVFARTGATVGKTYLHESGDAIYAGYLIKYQMNPQKIRPAFLMAYTHSRPYYNWVSKTQKVGAQPNISAAQYDSMPVLVPTLHEQDAFLTIYKQADKSKYIN